MADIDDEMARAFGNRPSGQENRVWVDHEGIIAAVMADDPLDDLFGYTGLSELKPDDPKLPPALRRLLTAYANRDEDDNPALVALALVGLVLAVGGGIAAFAGFSLGETLAGIGMGMAIGGLIASALLSVALDMISDLFGGRPLWGQPRHRILRAVRPLQARPFVIVAEGKLIENLPSVSWLETRQSELKDAAEQANDRASHLDRIREELKKARHRLGEDGPDAQDAQMAKAKADWEALSKRADDLRKRLADREAKIHARLTELQNRVDVEALRAQAAELTGQAVPSTPEKIAADVEVDVADLAKDVTSLQSDIADQEAHFAAMNEVSAASTV